MRQLIVGSGSITTGGTYYSGLSGSDGFWTTTEAEAQHPWSCSGTFRNLRVRVTTAAGAGDSHIFAVLIDGVASALTVTISNTDTEGVDLANDVTITAGQRVSLRRINTTFDAAGMVKWSLEFEGDTAQESGYGVWSAGQLAGGGPFYHAAFTPRGTTNIAASHALSAIAGTITRYDVLLRVAPGGAATDDFVYIKNGVEQNGSGGTPDTRLTITGATTTGTASGFSLSVAPGDLLQIKGTQTGGAATTHVGVGTKFVADVDGFSNLSPISASSEIPTGATNWANLARTVWTTTEADAQQTIDASYWLSAFYVNANAPGVGTFYTFTLRHNGATPATSPSVTITGAGSPTTGSDVDPSHVVALAALDTLALQSVPAGGPTAVQIFFALSVSDRSPAPIPMCHPTFPALFRFPFDVVGY